MTDEQLQTQEIEEPKLFTQRELDEIIDKRLGRLHRKYQKVIIELTQSVAYEGGE